MFLIEILQNPVFKERYSKPWLKQVWLPLVACLDGLQAKGLIAADADTRFLGRSFLSQRTRCCATCRAIPLGRRAPLLVAAWSGGETMFFRKAQPIGRCRP